MNYLVDTNGFNQQIVFIVCENQNSEFPEILVMILTVRVSVRTLLFIQYEGP